MAYNTPKEVAFGKIFEKRTAEAVAAKLWPGCRLVAAHGWADIDFLVVGEDADSGDLKHIAFLEVKARRIPITRYESTIVSMRKHHAGRWGKEFYKVPTICIVLFTDALATFDLHATPDGKENITRHDNPGVTVEHALYLHKRFERHDELLEGIHAAIEADQ
jgi:hypothetical protein